MSPSFANQSVCMWAGLFLMLAPTYSRHAVANLLVNGSLESPALPPATYANYLGGATAIEGWTVVGLDAALVEGSYADKGIAFTAQQGNQWIDLAGLTANSPTSGISQSVATQPDTIYTLSFYVGSASDQGIYFPSTVDLQIDDGERTSFLNPASPREQLNWQKFTTSFTARRTTTTLTFYHGGDAQNYLSALDNITLLPALSPCDFNEDGSVDAADAAIMFEDWGEAPESIADKNGDLLVDAADAGVFFADWTGDAQSMPEPTRYGMFPLIALHLWRRRVQPTH